MRPVTPFENVLLKAGNAQPVAACLLDCPAALETVLAELLGACGRLPRMRSAIVGRAGWLWRRDIGDVDPAAHVRIVDGVADMAGLGRLMAAIPGLPLPAGRPPWQVYVVNPAPAIAGPHAIVLHFDHSIADGHRMDRLVRTMGAFPVPEPARRAAAAAMPGISRVELSRIAERPARRLALAQAPAGRSGRIGPRRFVEALAHALRAPGVSKAGATWRATALEVVADGSHRAALEGNYIRFRATDTFGKDEAVRTLAYRLIAPTGPWGFGWGALFPRFLLRPLLAFWYRQFDMLVSYLPGARAPFALGGARVTAIWAMAPLLADLPACLTVYAGFGSEFVTLQTGTAVEAEPARLVEAAIAGVRPGRRVAKAGADA